MHILWYCFFLRDFQSFHPFQYSKDTHFKIFSYCSFLFSRYKISYSDWLFLLGFACTCDLFILILRWFSLKVPCVRVVENFCRVICHFILFFFFFLCLDLISWLRNPILHWWFELWSHTWISRRFGCSYFSWAIFFSPPVCPQSQGWKRFLWPVGVGASNTCFVDKQPSWLQSTQNKC